MLAQYSWFPTTEWLCTVWLSHLPLTSFALWRGFTLPLVCKDIVTSLCDQHRLWGSFIILLDSQECCVHQVMQCIRMHVCACMWAGTCAFMCVCVCVCAHVHVYVWRLTDFDYRWCLWFCVLYCFYTNVDLRVHLYLCILNQPYPSVVYSLWLKNKQNLFWTLFLGGAIIPFYKK